LHSRPAARIRTTTMKNFFFTIVAILLLAFIVGITLPIWQVGHLKNEVIRNAGNATSAAQVTKYEADAFKRKFLDCDRDQKALESAAELMDSFSGDRFMA
jgi:hypothetical protein